MRWSALGVPLLWGSAGGPRANIKYQHSFCREKGRDEKKRDREEDEEEAYERRKLERKLREKEAAYQEVNWRGKLSCSFKKR